MEKGFPIVGILKLLQKEKDCVFLENGRLDAQNYLSYLFLRPKRIVSTRKIQAVQGCLADLDQALRDGYYVAGFIAYEAGEAFEETLKTKCKYAFPLLWFGVYQKPLIYDHRKGSFLRASQEAQQLIKAAARNKDKRLGAYALKDIRPNISPKRYLKAIKSIKGLIAQGFTYQVNYTFKMRFSFRGSAAGLYCNLREHQNTAYQALIKCGRYTILSFSPELFFRKKANLICARPMKGTARRGRDLKEDREIAVQLEHCPKNRSENIMIVDLLRNDLGKVAQTGSVSAPSLFNVEKYQTLFQMTSDIKSRLRPNQETFAIFEHIFPSGSVTGAPKIKTMQIIRQLEKAPRQVYTGAIGFAAPDAGAVFNVAIRTILIDKKTNQAQMGVGSGIVYDSKAQAEFAECRLKERFLTKRKERPAFALLETMPWQRAHGYLFLQRHLKRLADSASYFDFAFDRRKMRLALRRLAKTFSKDAYRLRVLLDKDGKIKLQAQCLKPMRLEKLTVCLSSRKTNTHDPFLYHKTTNRRFYDDEHRRYRRLGFYDVIFTNERGELTEGAISNIFLRKGANWYTPPIKSGLLNGVYRRYLLDTHKYPIAEKPLFVKDIMRADKIYLSNSVRGLVPVQLQRKK